MKQNKILQRNLQILKEINPDLFGWFENADSIDWIQEIKSSNRNDNLLIKTGSQYYPAYSMEDPEEEAKK
ncbi:hypothetical protein LCGC14_2874630, partial [marine sediment metagenome]